MPFISGSDLVADVLFRSGEVPGSSEWDGKVIDYLNRVYAALCSGASEFLPETVEDWWWMRDSGTFILDPVIDTGTVSVTNGSATVTFSVAPGNIADYRLRVKGDAEVYIIDSIVGTTATLDGIYVGDTNAAVEFEAMHVVVNLSASVQAVIGPIISSYGNPQIFGTTPERMDFLFPTVRLQGGGPVAFCLESETRLRFSHGGRTDGKRIRMEFRYRPIVAALENTSISVPLVPAQYRHLLADMALVYMFSDKNDDRLASVGQSARAGLMAMVKENKRRLTKVDQHSGAIFARQGGAPNSRKPLRTETGLIIG